MNSYSARKCFLAGAPLLASLFLAALLPLAAQNTPVGTPPEAEDIVDRAQSTPGGSGAAAASSTGAQRVVRQKQSKWGGFVGAGLDYLYRSNALSVNEPIGEEIRSDVLLLTGYGFVSYGPTPTGKSAVTQLYLGGLVQETQHQENLVEFADFRTDNIYVMSDTTFRNGLSLAGRLEYAQNVNSDSDNTDFSEVYPSFSVRKFWAVGDNSNFRAVVRTGYHFTDVDDFGGLGGRTDDQLDNWETSLAGAYFWTKNRFILNPTARLIYQDYGNGQNADRSDFTYQLGLRATYRYNFLNLSAFVTYTKRNSDIDINDFENFDAGAGLSASYRW